MQNFQDKVGLIWAVANLLRGNYKASDYAKVILPFTVLRRLDCVIASSRAAVYRSAKQLPIGLPPEARESMLLQLAGKKVYLFNLSNFSFSPVDAEAEERPFSLLSDTDNLAANLRAYIDGFSSNIKEPFELFGFDQQITKLKRNGLLLQVMQTFAAIKLHPDEVPNATMGLIFEELIRKFSEQSNETAGEHFTPREVIELMVRLLFAPDRAQLKKGAVSRSLFDPACGTGGMLTAASRHLADLNSKAHLDVYGQELNPESYAICASDLVLKGHDPKSAQHGNSFSNDQFPDKQFDYMLANPPFGVSWQNVRSAVEDEAKAGGGRFDAGTPRINDGSLLFLQHMLSKRRPILKGGSRMAIVFNGSPLFTGSAGSGESEIRRWIIENDWLETIIALPDQMFYNTGISTYIWVVTNRKAPEHRGKVRLVNAVGLFEKMRKSLGDKRKMLSADNIDQIVKMVESAEDGEGVKTFDNHAFAFWRITVERPLRVNVAVTDARLAALKAEKPWVAMGKKPKNAAKRAAILAAIKAESGKTFTEWAVFRKALEARFKAGFTHDGKKAKLGMTGSLEKLLLKTLGAVDPKAKPVVDLSGAVVADPKLRDNENVPLREGLGGYKADPDDHLSHPSYRPTVDAYIAAEVLPHVPDAWVVHESTKVGVEIPFTRHFYVYTPPRPLVVIEAEIRGLEAEIQGMLGEVFA